MNEYDDILNRIVEEFYDTGKFILEGGKSLTNDELRKIAKKYKTKNEWRLNDYSTYRQAHKRNKNFPGFWEDITKHMELINSSKKHIYGYEFYDKEDNPIAVYVGLTCDMTRRKEEHLTGYCKYGKRETTVFKFINANPNLKYEIKLLEPEQYIGKEAEQKEKEWIEKYRQIGWRILNKAKAGALGSLFLNTDDELRKIAKKYKTKNEWKLNDSPTYQQAQYRNKNFPGFWEDITKHMKDVYVTVDDDELRKIAKKYKTKSAWMKSTDSKYYWQAFRKNKKNSSFFDYIAPHFIKNKLKVYSDDINLSNDTDNDGIPNRLDLDIDGDGNIDIVDEYDNKLDEIIENFFDTGKFVF